MQTKQYTRRLLAGFMLVVFAFSITPRIVLHGWFASHKDNIGVKLSHTDNQQFAKAAYHCNCDNIVAESPFTGASAVFELTVFKAFSIHQKTPVSSFYSTAYFLFSLRGPPATA